MLFHVAPAAAADLAVVSADQELRATPNGPVLATTRAPLPVEVSEAWEGGFRVRTATADGPCYAPAHDAVALDLWVPESAFADVLVEPVAFEAEGFRVSLHPGLVVTPRADGGFVAVDEGLRVEANGVVGRRYTVADARPMWRDVPTRALARDTPLLDTPDLRVMGLQGAPGAFANDGAGGPNPQVWLLRACVDVRIHRDPGVTTIGRTPTLPPPTPLPMRDVAPGTQLLSPEGHPLGTVVGALEVPQQAVGPGGCFELGWARPLTGARVSLCDPALPRGYEVGEPLLVHSTQVRRRTIVPPKLPKSATSEPASCQVQVTLDADGTPTDVTPTDCAEPWLEATRTALLASRWYPHKVGTARVPVRFSMTVRYGS